MTFQAVTKHATDTYKAMQIAGMEQAIEIAQALAAAIAAGTLANGSPEVYADPQTGAPTWRLKLTLTASPEPLFAHQGDWLVLTNDTHLDVLKDPDYTATYTTPGDPQ